MRGKALVLLFVLLAGGCGGAAAPETGPVGRRDPNRITFAELRETNGTSVYDAVRAIRPIWLRTRGQTSFGTPQEVVIYIDGVRMGGPENLQSMEIDNVESMQYIDALTANQRFGIDHTNGAIMVETR